MKQQTSNDYSFQAVSKGSSILNRDTVSIHAIGEITTGPQVFVDGYPQTSVLFIQPIDGEIEIHLSDGRDINLRTMEFSVVFPGRLITILTRSKRTHIVYLSLKGPKAVESTLKLGFWEFQCETDDFPVNYFRQVCDTFQKSGCRGDDPDTLLAVERMMRTMAARRLHCGGNTPLFSAIRAINNLDLRNFTTDAAARALGISRSSLNNLFREARFMNPGRYMDSVRVALAKEMLYNTKGSTATIADRLGFADENSFSMFFKRRDGRTPAQFRKNPILILDKTPRSANDGTTRMLKAVKA